MPQQQDYILRMIEQLGAMIREALGKLKGKDPDARPELAGQAIGLALSMDPETASKLTPTSLVALLSLGEVDGRVIGLLQEALEIEASVLEDQGDLVTAMLRRDQAAALSGAPSASDVSYTA